MSVSDGMSILKGSDDAATQFLKKATSAQLTEKMRPVINNSLANVNATKYWDDFITAANILKNTYANQFSRLCNGESVEWNFLYTCGRRKKYAKILQQG